MYYIPLFYKLTGNIQSIPAGLPYICVKYLNENVFNYHGSVNCKMPD